RWAALLAFHGRHGHFLVTSGPYRLQRATSGAVTLAVFRDLSYPVAVGAFDRLAQPRRGFVTAVERRDGRLALPAEIETVSRAGRSYKIVREPLATVAAERFAPPLQARWVVVGADAEVLAAGTTARVEGGAFIVELPGRLPPGEHRVLVALAVDGNLVNPEVKVIPYRVSD
ncbi:MAG TPA: hypothetical protein VFX28_22245, partial [Methylomirabilota bacterium]|nr:hypothetical protein [Methylomirabilota bacterium]